MQKESRMADTAERTDAVIYSFPQAPGVGREVGSLHTELLEALRELVIHGDLAPGSRVPERILCQRFGVSRTPLREALKVLAAEGLVRLYPNRGARVSALDEGDLHDLFEVIGMLEGEAGRLACERMTDAAIAEVQALHYRMYAHFLREELPEYFQLNQAIHRAILDGAKNALLAATHRQLAGRIVRARYMSNRLGHDRWKQAVEEHGQILEALVRRDGDRLAGILRTHLANKRDVIAEYLRSMAEEQAVKAGSRRKRRNTLKEQPASQPPSQGSS
jgi:DNA-binding GntR family transcriptional regulator